MELVLRGRATTLSPRGIVKWECAVNDGVRFAWQGQYFKPPRDRKVGMGCLQSIAFYTAGLTLSACNYILNFFALDTRTGTLMYKLALRGQAARAQRHDLPTTRAWAGKVGTNPTQDGGEQANKQTSKEDQLQTKSSKQITKPIQILPNGVTSTIPKNSNREKRNIYFPFFAG